MLPFFCYCADTKTVAQQKGWVRWAPGPAVSENGVKTPNFHGILTIFQWSIPHWTIFFWHILRHFLRDSHFRGSGWHWVQQQIDPGSEPEPRLWCICGHWAPTWIIPRYPKWQRCLIKVWWYLWMAWNILKATNDPPKFLLMFLLVDSGIYLMKHHHGIVGWSHHWIHGFFTLGHPNNNLSEIPMAMESGKTQSFKDDMGVSIVRGVPQ